MVAIKDMKMPSDCYNCLLTKNERTNDYGSFCKCGILEDSETINLLKHSKHYNCPLVEIEERKVGKWIDCGFIDKSFRQYKCSKCSNFVYEKEYSIKYHKHCLHCGAEMKQE